MKLTILFLVIASFCYGQKTKIKADQIDESALRSQSGGALSTPWEVTFDKPKKKYTLSVTSDIELSMAASPDVDSEIIIIATGDGTHLLTFPSDWEAGNNSDVYDPNKINKVLLEYNGVGVIYEITGQTPIDVLVTDLESAIVTNEVPTQLTILFNEAMNISEFGWTMTASAGAVTIESVTGSGTTTPIFILSRAILHSETVTVSYSGGIEGVTTDLAGFELADIVDFPVTVPDPPPPVTQDCDITVCASGCDFTTITAANAAAATGDIICVGNGTYREAITVADNSVTFVNTDGETPTCSCLEVVGTSGWTVHSGNIYKKTITLPVNGYNTSTSAVTSAVLPNTTLFANQILRNGDMMMEARFPNITTFAELMQWETYKQYAWTAGFKATQLNDTGLPTSPPALVGSTIVSNGWYDTFARTITGHDNSGPGSTERVTYAAIRDDTDPGQWMRQAYYLVGDLDLLDAEGEWHYQSGTLYFWQPGGGTPTGTIEYKARNWAFDLRGRSGVTIKGLTFIGCDPVVTDAASTNTTIERTFATFNNHVVRHDYFLWNGVQIGMAKQLGTKLLGANSVFKDNEWGKSASILLWLGPNVTVENNLLYSSGYAGNSGGAISVWAQDGGQIITRNTIHDQGRGAIFFGYVERGHHDNMEISYNHFYDYGTINGDGGATYAGDQTILAGLNMHHNWMHGHQYRSTPGFGGLNGGIYFDQGSGGGGGATVHHNVVWDNMTGDIYHLPIYNGFTNATFNIYNNTFASDLSLTYGGVAHSYKTPSTSPLDVQRNNIYVRRILVNWEAGNVGNNANYIYQYGNGTDPLFVGSGGDGLNYRIQTTSPAKNAGQVIAGITDDAVGVPDIGAYEFGGVDWVPGYVAPANDGTVNDDEWSYTVNWTEDNTGTSEMIDLDSHYTFTVTTATATSPEFTNAKAKIYFEGCQSHGIAQIDILNASDVVIATHDFDTYNAVDCNSAIQVEYEFTGLAAGTKRARVFLKTVDLGATPPKNSLVLDGGKFSD